MKYSRRKYTKLYNRKTHRILSQRSHNRKRYHIGGSGSDPQPTLTEINTLISQINSSSSLEELQPTLTEINTLISQINSSSSLEELQQLEKFADVMTVSQTIDLKKQLSKYKHTLPTNISRNINILTELTKLTNTTESTKLYTIYSTFPICKIDTQLNDIEITIKDTKITNDEIQFNNKTYKFKAEGSFGRVYTNNTGINQAIKIIINTKSDPAYLESLINYEIINYNNISSIVCSDEGDNNYFCKFKKAFIDLNSKPIKLYVIMEYCGTNFHTFINYQPIQTKLTLSILIKLFKTISMGIKCMHENGYVHLDIKPANITIYDINNDISNIKAKLIDFGISQKITEITDITFHNGTPLFMCPEMKTSISVLNDYTKCDIYSLGITFAYILQIKYFSWLWLYNNANLLTYNDDENKQNSKKVLKLIGLEKMLDATETRLDIYAVIDQLNTLQTSESKSTFEKDKLYNADFSLMDIYNYYPEPATFEYFKSKKIPIDKYFENLFKIKDLIDNGVFTPDELKQGYSISNFINEYPLNDLKTIFGFTLDDFIPELRKGNVNLKQLTCIDCFTIEELKNAGIPLLSFNQEGFSVQELKGDTKFSLQEFIDLFLIPDSKFFSLRELTGTDCFTIAELKSAGISLKRFNQAGFSVQELKDDGKFLLKEFIDLFRSSKNTYKFSLHELTDKDCFTIAELKSDGITFTEFINAGFELTHLIDNKVFTVEEIKELKDYENILQPFIIGGYKVKKLIEFGFELSDILMYLPNASPYLFLSDLLRPGCFTIKELVNTGRELYTSGTELFNEYITQVFKNTKKDTGEKYTAKELIEGDFTVEELKRGGFTVEELKKEGFTIEQMREGGFTAKQLKQEGFTIKQMREGGFTVAILKKEGFTIEQMKEGGFTVEQLKKEGFTVEQLKKEGFTIELMRKGGFTVEEIFKAGYEFKEIKPIYDTYNKEIKELKKRTERYLDSPEITNFNTLKENLKKCERFLSPIKPCTYDKITPKNGGRYSNKKSRRTMRNK